MPASTLTESRELQHKRSVGCSITSHAKQLSRLGNTRRRLPTGTGRHPRQRDYVQPTELLPTPSVLLADRVVILLRVQSTVLANGVLPQLGENCLCVVAQLAIARRHGRRPSLVLAAQCLVQRRDQLLTILRLDLLNVLDQRVRLVEPPAGLPRSVVCGGNQAGERVPRA